MTLSEKSVHLHGQKLNCAQSVLGACSEYTGIDEKLAYAISVGFGGGVRAGEICGAISGAVMAIGKVCSDKGHPELAAGYAKALVNEFREKYGSARCIELKQNGHPCDELIAAAAEYAENALNDIIKL